MEQQMPPKRPPGRPPKQSEIKRAFFQTRIRESVKRRLEADAAKQGRSLSEEIELRLEQSIADQELGRVVFGSEESYVRLASIDRMIRAIEVHTGKGMEDRATRDLAADTVCSFLKHGGDIFATLAERFGFRWTMAGKPPSPGDARNADAYTFTLIAAGLHRDIERRTEDAADAKPAGDEAEPR